MKLKYIFFLSAALSLTGCNDGFLDRGPQDLNDNFLEYCQGPGNVCKCFLWHIAGRGYQSGR